MSFVKRSITPEENFNDFVRKLVEMDTGKNLETVPEMLKEVTEDLIIVRSLTIVIDKVQKQEERLSLITKNITIKLKNKEIKINELHKRLAQAEEKIESLIRIIEGRIEP